MACYFRYVLYVILITVPKTKKASLGIVAYLPITLGVILEDYDRVLIV